MKKYNITYPIRKPNPYKHMMRATKEHRVVKDKVKRKFKQGVLGKILLTDITYLYYSNSQRAYLSAIKYDSTNEILAYNISKSLKLNIVLNTIDQLTNNTNIKLEKDVIIHSDQGTHYTSPI